MKTILKSYRDEIDQIDKQISKLFQQRIELAKDIAKVKKNENLPILNSQRENEVIANVKSHVDTYLQNDIVEIYQLIMKISRKCQGYIG